jgi:hypothetical protein
VITYTPDELMAFAVVEDALGDDAVRAGDYNAATALYHSCQEALALARQARESEDR